MDNCGSHSIAEGGMARLYVPKSLGRADAERIAVAAKALAVGEAEAVNGQSQYLALGELAVRSAQGARPARA
jgi:hypothetical protein